MSNDNPILEPITEYHRTFKNKVIEEATKVFDELVQNAELNTNENKETCKKYYKANENLESAKKLLNKYKAIRTICIVFSIILLIVAIASGIFCTSGENLIIFIPLCVISGILGLLLLIIPLIKLKDKIHNANLLVEEKTNIANDIQEEAFKQMQRLNMLYDWNLTCKVINNTANLIHLDPFFDVKKYQFLHEKYGFSNNDNKDVSTISTLSGNILGNPFVVLREMSKDIIDKVYTGSIVITWVTYGTDSRGRSVPQHHSQTLMATVTAPAPRYQENTYLVYPLPVAEDLSFTHLPTVEKGCDEKDINKIVKKNSKKIQKLVKESISDKDPNTNFTAMGNMEFDSLFNATDRDHEVQFRLLFTPLAQRNMVKLLTTAEPFGDDFIFSKVKCFNYIKSNHSQNFDYSMDPSRYINFDCENAKKIFVDYQYNFFTNLYFDLAPLLAIPLYQQTKTFETIYDFAPITNVTNFEGEVLANKLNSSGIYTPEECITKTIIKTSLISKEDGFDLLKVNSYGYKGINHVTYVSKMGGDGHLHEVPVHWIEYIPVELESTMNISNINSSLSDYRDKCSFMDRINDAVANNNMTFERNLFAYAPLANANIEIMKRLDDFFKNREK